MSDDSDDSDDWGNLELGSDASDDNIGEDNDDDDDEVPIGEKSSGSAGHQAIKNEPELILKGQQKVKKIVRDLQQAKLTVKKALADKSNSDYDVIKNKLSTAPDVISAAIAKYEDVLVKDKNEWKHLDLKDMKKDVMATTKTIHKYIAFIASF